MLSCPQFAPNPANFVIDGIQYCKDKGTLGGRWENLILQKWNWSGR